jgi:c-di-GMP-binding flagellar brake protein YcgR
MMQALDSAHASKMNGALQSSLINGTDNTAGSDSVIAFNNLPVIARILDDACARRATVTIKLETGSKLHIYHSRIQSVDTIHMQMVLHKLMPSNWVDLITQEYDVEVNCQLPSGLLRFRSTIAPLEADAINPYCVLTLPQTLYKHQLRSSYRVIMPPGSSSLTLPYGERRIQGFCLNLSLEGCCGIFRGELDTLTRDAPVPDLTVSLDDSLQFTTDATVCRRQVMQNGSLQLGLRFDALDTDVQRKLQVSLTSLQRRQLRKSPSL